ncbi:methylenetetrahydrofolate reductase C-terminal domain-containing protein [Providencia rettgeri]|nr:methylenetetrahydrofolate reductase C-terminal domain-containing protein [Providencia rettgeri]EJD6642659.1 methylenetetrahydrofolate reductase C-terminal domain-containing protein [Providencia rettgeri]ELL9152267.1 methylenetetrahydrofolate reductase C-terminal domain-containing protein [Providencia rettgeri]ELR5047075.1 methylenetetrahydrofolate reductase C-terminal domain-containing protein [Providencia rettgeri]ELR5059915.1 methylenetetrahydrofolate reductase C-terminal domain-containing
MAFFVKEKHVNFKTHGHHCQCCVIGLRHKICTTNHCRKNGSNGAVFRRRNTGSTVRHNIGLC